jgi:class 3 adenylate cyclase
MTDRIGSAARAAARITTGRRGGALGAARSLVERLRAEPAGGQPDQTTQLEPVVDDAEVARLRAELERELERLTAKSG